MEDLIDDIFISNKLDYNVVIKYIKYQKCEKITFVCLKIKFVWKYLSYDKSMKNNINLSLCILF